MLKKHPLSVVCAVLLGFTWAGSIIAAEQRPDEMIVAMASSKSICGGNTGRACPGTAPAPHSAGGCFPSDSSPQAVADTGYSHAAGIDSGAESGSDATSGHHPGATCISNNDADPHRSSDGDRHAVGPNRRRSGRDIRATPDGVKDVHIKLSGVSGTIKGVRITGLDGIWETPANGTELDRGHQAPIQSFGRRPLF